MTGKGLPFGAVTSIGSCGTSFFVLVLARAMATACELRLEGCLGRQFLTPMHSLKRRNCVTLELLSEVVIACVHCHRIGEAMKEADMAALVRGVIAARETPV